MQDFAWLLPMHITCVSMLFGVFIWRLFYVWQGHAIPFFWLRRGLPDVIDMMVLGSGLGLAVHFSITPWDDAWLAVKLGAVVLYIAAGFMCFSSRCSLRMNRVGGIFAVSLLMLIVYLAVTKNIFFA